MAVWLFTLVLLSRIWYSIAFNSTCIEIKGTYYHLLQNFETEKLFLSWKIIEIFETGFISRCVVACYDMTEQCQGVAYNNGKCYTLTSGYATLGNYWINDGTWAVYTRQGATMNLPIYRLSQGTGVEMRETWRSGHNSAKNEVAVRLNPTEGCHPFYRHAYVDNWRHWGVQMVELAFYTNRTRDAFATVKISPSTTIDNYFTSPRLRESSWTDLTSDQPTAFRTYAKSTDRDDFVYIRGDWKSCTVLSVWMLALRSDAQCATFPTYPQFLYAKHGIKQKLTSDKIGHSTDLVITAQIPL